MEFNYRATDHTPPLTFTPPIQGDIGMGWGLNGSSHMEGPNSATEMSHYLWREMEKVKIREEIMTQLEKERIREEVIVDEIVRRRLLEEDVRRELIMERELALRGGGVVIGQRGIPAPLLPCEMESRPLGQRFGNSDVTLGMPSVLRCESGGLLTGLQMTPQPYILESKPQLGNGKLKEKIVLPAKPLQNVNVSALSSACSEKRQLREEWSCALCQVTATCEQDLNVHLQGSRHKAKEAGLRKKTKNYKIGWCTESTSNKDAPSVGSKLLKKRDQNISKSAELGRLSQNPNNAKGKDEHSSGTRHLSQHLKSNQNTHVMQVGQKLTVTEKEGIDGKNSASEDLSVVMVELEGQQKKEVDIDPETFSVNPEKKGDPLVIISQQLGNRNSVRNRGEPTARTQVNKKNSLRFWCDICQIGTDTKKVMEIHQTGKKHLACKKQMFPFWCDVCQVGADTEKVMEFHKAGKRHLSQSRLPDIKKSASEDLSAVVQKVELEGQQQVDSETSSVTPEKTVGPLIKISQQLGNSVNNSGTPTVRTQENKNSLRFWCDICQIGTDTEKVMEIHRMGKKHLALKQMFRFWCDVCQVGADTEKAMEIHKAGKKHLSRPRLPVINETPGNLPPIFSMQPISGAEANSLDTNVCMKKKLLKNRSQFSNKCMKQNGAPVRRIKETRGLKKNSFKFWCELCHVGADSKEEIEAHWYGKKHQKVIKSLVGEK